MQDSRARHVVTLVSALAIPMLAVAILIPGAASATTPKAVAGSCTHLSGSALVSSGPGGPSLSGCSPSPNAPGTGTFTFPFAPSGTATIHWSNGATTSFTFKAKVTSSTKLKKGVAVANPKFHCPAGDSVESALKGKIPKTGNGSLPSGDTGLKGAVKATVCLSATDNLSLLPNTTFSL